MNKIKRKNPKPRIYTIVHSNRSINEFLEILQAYKLKLLVDVRTVPKSLHNPQFGMTKLKNKLNKHGIEYIHIAELGGFRHAKKDSENDAWRNLSFRGFADYMQTEGFLKGLKKLINRLKRKKLVMMCSEAVPWRCHRSLIADALLIRDITAEDIFSPTNHKPHKLTSFAKTKGTKITYPA